MGSGFCCVFVASCSTSFTIHTRWMGSSDDLCRTTSPEGEGDCLAPRSVLRPPRPALVRKAAAGGDPWDRPGFMQGSCKVHARFVPAQKTAENRPNTDVRHAKRKSRPQKAAICTGGCSRYQGTLDALLDNLNVFGFYYTQLTDVEQEHNGLYYYNRKPKFDVQRLRAITSRSAAYENTERH